MNIYDIAQLAGVSIATVSRVLNNSPNVSEKTRKKVASVIQSAGYTPNIFAQGLTLNSIKRIGILCTDVADLYYAQAVSILERLLRQYDYDVLLYCTGTCLEEKHKCLQRLVEKKVDAIITIGSLFWEGITTEMLHPIATQLPVFLINATAELDNTFSIFSDQFGASRQAVSELVAAGYSHPLFLYDLETPSNLQKKGGFLAGIEKHHLQNTSAMVSIHDTIPNTTTYVANYLQTHPGIDAIFATDDLLAVAALHGLAQIGKTLPVIGFNNSFITECTKPTLTSIDNLVEELCTTTVSLLTALFKNKTIPQHTKLAPQIVYRESF